MPPTTQDPNAGGPLGPGQAAADASKSTPHRAAKRALELIEVVVESDHPLTLSELAARVGVPKSTAHALLHTLAEEDFLERTEAEGRFRAGPRLLRLAGRVPSQFELPRLARPILQELADEFGETALLGIRRGAHIFYVEQVESPQFIRYAVPVGEPRPLHCTSIGKLFMAYMEPGELRRLLSMSIPQSHTAHTTTDIEALVREARAVRAQGYSFNLEESISGATAVGAPIFSHHDDSRLLAGVSVVGPTHRVQPHLETAVVLVKRAAERIAATIA